MTTHIFIAFIASFVTSSQATSDKHTITFLWSPSFHFISLNTKWQGSTKKEKKRHFPTNPHYGMKIYPTPNDLKALGDCQMLNTQLLDCLLQSSAPPPNEETCLQVYLGSLGTRSYMESCNTLVNVDRGPLAPSNWNRI